MKKNKVKVQLFDANFLAFLFMSQYQYHLNGGTKTSSEFYKEVATPSVIDAMQDKGYLNEHGNLTQRGIHHAELVFSMYPNISNWGLKSRLNLLNQLLNSFKDECIEYEDFSQILPKDSDDLDFLNRLEQLKAVFFTTEAIVEQTVEEVIETTAEQE